MDYRIGVLQAGLEHIARRLHARIDVGDQLQNLGGVAARQGGQKVARLQLEKYVNTARFRQADGVVQCRSLGDPNGIVFQCQARGMLEGQCTATGTRADDHDLSLAQAAGQCVAKWLGTVGRPDYKDEFGS